MTLDKDLLEILACPACHTEVRLEADRLVCVNPSCKLRFRIKDGIPVMLIEEAEKH